MKKAIIALALLVIIFSGCSTSPNNNGGSTTTVVPVAPSNLTGSVLSSSSVSLNWVDNATNETGFKIERRLNGVTQFSVVGTVNAEITTFTDSNLVPSTTYEYRVYSFNVVGNSITYSNTVILTTINVPILTTAAISSITISSTVSAASGGEITNDGGSPITARGVVWDTSPLPTIVLNTKTNDSTGIGSFISNITGLTGTTTYYIRAYATNSAGTSYGNEISFTTPQPYSYLSGPVINDIDGNAYPSITNNCGQTWTSINFNSTHYRNGDSIPEVTDPTQWANLTTGAWCWYNNDYFNRDRGRLYNWYAVNDPRGLAPIGWHVSTDADWNIITKCIDYTADTTLCCSNVAANALKSSTTWSLGGGTNSSGLDIKPYSIRNGDGGFMPQGSGILAYLWTSSELSTTDSWYRKLEHFSSFSQTVLKKYGGLSPKKGGLYVRLVKD